MRADAVVEDPSVSALDRPTWLPQAGTMVETAKREATYEDLVAAPRHLFAKILLQDIDR
jgi:hypothetical protein